MSEPSAQRLVELVAQMDDVHTELGPLDRADIKLALAELIGWREAGPSQMTQSVEVARG